MNRHEQNLTKNLDSIALFKSREQALLSTIDSYKTITLKQAEEIDAVKKRLHCILGEPKMEYTFDALLNEVAKQLEKAKD